MVMEGDMSEETAETLEQLLIEVIGEAPYYLLTEGEYREQQDRDDANND